MPKFGAIFRLTYKATWLMWYQAYQIFQYLSLLNFHLSESHIAITFTLFSDMIGPIFGTICTSITGVWNMTGLRPITPEILCFANQCITFCFHFFFFISLMKTLLCSLSWQSNMWGRKKLLETFLIFTLEWTSFMKRTNFNQELNKFEKKKLKITQHVKMLLCQQEMSTKFASSNLTMKLKLLLNNVLPFSKCMFHFNSNINLDSILFCLLAGTKTGRN